MFLFEEKKSSTKKLPQVGLNSASKAKIPTFANEVENEMEPA